MKDNKVTVESVIAHSETNNNVPTLLNFENGQLSVTRKENAQFSLMQDAKKRKSAMVVTNEYVYHGPVSNSEADKLTDLYLCVRDKITNKVRVVPIEQAQLSNDIYNTLEISRMADMTNETTFKKLLKEFGGRMATKYIQKADDFKMNTDLIKKEVDNTINATTIAESDDVDNELQYDVIRPKFNKDATILSEVYDVGDIVPSDLLDAMHEEATTVYNTKISELPIKSDFIRKYIEEIQKSDASPKNTLKLKLVIYMDAVLNLITSSHKSMKSYELSGITEKVEIDVRTRFCDQNTKNLLRTTTYTEKAICHFIVLALLVSDKYEVNVNDLSRELQTKKSKVLQYAQLVNARQKSKGDILTLKLPKNVPALRGAFVKGKRK